MTNVYDRMISERQNIAASYTAQGEAEAQKIRNETDKNVKVMVADANKNAEIKIAEGEAEYMKILQEAYNTPEKADFYNFLRRALHERPLPGAVISAGFIHLRDFI